MNTSKQVSVVANLYSRGSRYRMLAFLAVIVALTAISTHGTLDTFADELLGETTAESFGLYVSARGINAAVSVFQSAEVNAVVGSLSVGEALDPVNDAVERFSSVMVLAIGSLLLQEVVLAFVSSTVFKWIFALVGVVTLLILAVVWRRRAVGAPGVGLLDRFCGAAVKIFVLASIVRFIVPVFVVVSYLAAQALLQPEIDRQSGELSAISEEVSIDGQQVLDELAVVENGQENQDGDVQSTEEQGSWLDLLRAAADRILPDIGLPDLRMPDFSILPALLDRAAQLAEYLTRLLVLIAVKNIFLPLVFLALALKVIRPFTARLLAMTSAIDRDLKDIKQTANEIGSEGSSALPKP
ncbi:MAG: hypothetical protein OXQ89_20085 [Rhodospirillaceae bacterium]|nr:hypothetical protein [Rhodospirillaceae bacterium]